MPLPRHIDPQKVIAAIATAKDVDGFSVRSRRRADGRPARLAPVHALRLHEADREHRQSTCAASTRWSSAAATPSASRWRCCCCRPTPPSPSATAPRPTWPCTRARPTSWWPRSAGATRSRADMVKPGAIVIDVGMNRNDAGKLCGDVDFDGVRAGRRLDHAGARRRRPDDDHDAAGQHARGRRARRRLNAAARRRRLTNPLLHRWPAGFAAIRPEHVGPAHRRAAGRRRRGAGARRRRRGAGRLRRAVGRARRGDRAAGPRLGRGGPPATPWPTRPSCARPTTRTCPRSPTSTPGWAPTSACTPSTRPWPPARRAAR